MPRSATRPPAVDEWMTVKDAAELIHVGLDAIYEACARQELRHVKIGHSSIRLRRDWLDAWLDSRTRGGIPAESERLAR